MEVLPANEETLNHAAKLMGEGKLVVFYADGVYALGCDAFNERAVEQLFEVKQRKRTEALQVVIAKEDIPEYAAVTDREMRMIDVILPGPISVVVKNKQIPAYVNSGLEIICIGWQENWIVQGLYYHMGRPYTGGSANVSNTPPPVTVEEAVRNLGDKVACYIDNGPTKYRSPNTIVDLTQDPIQMLRRGPASLQDVLSILEKSQHKS